MRTFKGTGTKLEGMYVILGMSRVTKPHTFFRKLGFTPGLPSEFMCWADDKLDMAYDFLQPFDELDALVANCNDISVDSNAKFKAAIKEKKAKNDIEGYMLESESEEEEMEEKQ